MMRRALAGALLCLAQGAGALEMATSLALTPDAARERRDSPYARPAARIVGGWRQDLGLRVAAGGAVGQFTLRTGARRGEAVVSEVDVNQLYLDRSLPGSAEHSWGLTVGKKILASPIGFGFRPLDVIQQENRRSFNAPPLTGVPLLALDALDADSAVGLVASGRPDHGRQREALTLRAVRSGDSHEIHAVAQAMAGSGMALGMGAAGTPPAPPGQGWDFAWHGALLWQQKAPLLRHALAEQPDAPPLAAADPLRPDWRRDVWKAVAGVQFNSAGGWGLLLEYWHDGSAWNSRQWRQLEALTRRQLALRGLAPEAAVDSNLAWSAGAFRAPSLRQDNVLTRLSYTAESWNAALEWLATPADGGGVLSLDLALTGNRQQARFGWQRLVGPGDSAYGRAPARDFLFARWLWAI